VLRLGLQKTSLVDYPGRVAAVLFTAGCNFRCPYCQNPGLVAPDPGADVLFSVDDALAFLDGRRALVSAVVISGGEPTLHPELPDLAASVRAMGFLVKVDTNGSCPEMLGRIGADYFAMDLKTDPELYARLWPSAPADASARLRESAALIRSSGTLYEFRITCAPGIFDEESARAVAELLKPGDPVFLQRCRLGTVLDPEWARGVSPYTDARLEGLLAIVRQAAPLARIRGG
jgi:pyruvate formate lyase activating enzyme